MLQTLSDAIGDLWTLDHREMLKLLLERLVSFGSQKQATGIIRGNFGFVHDLALRLRKSVHHYNLFPTYCITLFYKLWFLNVFSYRFRPELTQA